MNKHWSTRKSNHADKRRKQLKPFMFYRNALENTSKKGGIMDKFYDLLATSTIFQGAITVALVGTTCYLWITGQTVPDQLWTVDTIVIGFFFGAKSQQAIVTMARKRGG